MSFLAPAKTSNVLLFLSKELRVKIKEELNHLHICRLNGRSQCQADLPSRYIDIYFEFRGNPSSIQMTALGQNFPCLLFTLYKFLLNLEISLSLKSLFLIS